MMRDSIIRDVLIVDHVSLIGGENNIDEETRKSYQGMARRLRELAKRNMRTLKRKEKIKKICQN